MSNSLKTTCQRLFRIISLSLTNFDTVRTASILGRVFRLTRRSSMRVSPHMPVHFLSTPTSPFPLSPNLCKIWRLLRPRTLKLNDHRLFISACCRITVQKTHPHAHSKATCRVLLTQISSSLIAAHSHPEQIRLDTTSNININSKRNTPATPRMQVECVGLADPIFRERKACQIFEPPN